MGKKHDPCCKQCKWWVRDWDWAKGDPREERIMGDCYFAPPVLCQTLIPAVIRTSGYGQLRAKQEHYQMWPVVSSTSFCANFKKKGMK